MQLYKVKLVAGHTAKPDQIINGYLASFPDELGIYTRGEAIKKAKMFGGKIEKHGKNYTVNDSKIIQLAKQELSSAVLRELEGRELYEDTSSTFNEPIYFGNVFAAILGEITETIRSANTPELHDELTILDNICAKYEYVMIL